MVPEYVHALNVLPFVPETKITQSRADQAQLNVLRLLDARKQLSQREVASSLGMSLGRVNYCVRALISMGFVKVEDYRNSSNKLAYFYLLTPAGIAAKTELTRHFLARKTSEYDELRLEIERLREEFSAGVSASDPIRTVR